MAAIETRVIRLQNYPDMVNESNAVYGSFGWKVNGIQVTHAQDHKVEQLYNTISVETKTHDYVTITYERDMGMVNYDEVVALEKTYYALKRDVDAMDKAIDKDMVMGCLKAFLLFVFWPAGIYYLITKKYREEKKIREFDKKMEMKNKMEQRLLAIRAEARALL